MDIIGISSKAFLLGLSTGFYCTTSCLPLLLPTLFSRSQKRFGKISISLIQFLAGRFVAYLLFGLIAGLAGVYLAEYDLFQTIVIPAIYILIGILMIVYGITSLFKHIASCRNIDRKFQNPNYLFVLGFLMGINICPPFILAFGVASGLEDILKSILFFFLFFIATSIYFLPLLFSGFVSQTKLMHKIAKIASIVAGVYFIYLAIYTLLVLKGVIEYI